VIPVDEYGRLRDTIAIPKRHRNAYSYRHGVSLPRCACGRELRLANTTQCWKCRAGRK
jgi:hypothetical protein